MIAPAMPAEDPLAWTPDQARRFVAETVAGGLGWLPADEVQRLCERFGSPAALRAQRLGERDVAARDVVRLTGEPRPTPAAQMVARDLSRYLATAWRSNCALAELTGCSAYRAALHRLAIANEGRPLSARQIFDIEAGRRG